jgi:hypothetical protein
MWREHAFAPAPDDPPPDASGLVPAGDQAHVIPQAEAADWARECLVLPGSTATADDGLASIAAFRAHLTPLCQLAGVTEAAARVLRLAHGYLEQAADGLAGGVLAVQPWLFHVTALRGGDDPGLGEMRASPAALWAGVCDAGRFTAARDDGDGGMCLELAADETMLRLTALVTAAARGNESEMAALVDGDLSWPHVQERMFLALSRLAWAAGHMFEVPVHDARTVLTSSVFGTGTVPDLAGVLRRERPGIDPAAFFRNGSSGG